VLHLLSCSAPLLRYSFSSYSHYDSNLAVNASNALNPGFKPWEWFEGCYDTPFVLFPQRSFACPTRLGAACEAQTFLSGFLVRLGIPCAPFVGLPIRLLLFSQAERFSRSLDSSLLPCAISSYMLSLPCPIHAAHAYSLLSRTGSHHHLEGRQSRRYRCSRPRGVRRFWVLMAISDFGGGDGVSSSTFL
jgi:hypothetical protein